ncbi:MAG: hypothetical protein AAGA20_04120 [Planctomycetota bacterium]
MMTAVFGAFSLALLAQTTDIGPLRVERKLLASEQIALEFARFDRDPTGVVGWSKTSVDRGEIDGVTHFVVQRSFEGVDFESLGFFVMESRGLYDAELNLVHEIQTKGPLGGDAERFELEWGDEGLRWREGRGRWTQGSSEVRPTTATEIALMVHGLAAPTPWTGQVFDVETGQIEAQTLQPVRDTEERTSDDVAMKVFGVEGATPMSHFVSEDGVYVKAELDGLTVLRMAQLEDTELRLRRELADDALFEQFLARSVPKSWAAKGNAFTSESLGMVVELPKGWKRASEEQADGDLFGALSADGNAYLGLAVVPLGSGYTLEGWAPGFEAEFASLAVDEAVKTKKVKFAKHDAFRFEYVHSGKTPLESTAYVWVRNGLGCVLIGRAWEKAPKKLKRETRSVLESVKFER